MTTCNNQLVSIIVPVYNVECFCQKCFDSLIAIEYPQIEIILIDDCSTDESGNICDDYQHKFHNITVIHNERNSGVTVSRLTGLKYSHGNYVMFVDSDDYVDPQIVKKMIDTLSINQADLVSCQSYKVNGDSISIIERTIYGILNRDDILHLLSSNLLFDPKLRYAGMPTFLWGKLFKRNLLIGSLDKGLGLIRGEDTIAFLDILVNKANRIVCMKEPLYYYVSHANQVTGKPLHLLCSDYIKGWERLDQIYKDSGWSIQLTKRIWNCIKPSIYDSCNHWGGVINNKFVPTFRTLRNTEIVKKYLWNNTNLPKCIKKHPHYILIKYRLFWIDYLLHIVIWSLPKR